MNAPQHANMEVVIMTNIFVLPLLRERQNPMNAKAQHYSALQNPNTYRWSYRIRGRRTRPETDREQEYSKGMYVATSARRSLDETSRCCINKGLKPVWPSRGQESSRTLGRVR